MDDKYLSGIKKVKYPKNDRGFYTAPDDADGDHLDGNITQNRNGMQTILNI